MQSFKHNLRFFFIPREIHVPFLRLWNFNFLNYSLYFKSCDVTWVLAHEVEFIFEYIFWIVHHVVVKLGQIIDGTKYSRMYQVKSLQIFQRLSSTNVNWSILECFLPDITTGSTFREILCLIWRIFDSTFRLFQIYLPTATNPLKTGVPFLYPLKTSENL